MTEHKMLFSGRDLAKIIIPLMIENLLAVTVGMLDTMMVSSAGETAVSGVSLVDSLNLLLIYGFSALAAGGAVVISQLLGKKDYPAAQEAVRQLIWVVTAVSVAITVPVLIFRKPLLSLIFGQVEPMVMQNALDYFFYTVMMYPFLAIYHWGSAVFRAMGNTKVSMYASVLMNLLNLAGNAILIFDFSMGAAGAAISTLFSRVVGAGIMLVLMRNRNNLLYAEKLLRIKPNFAMIKNICGIGIPNGLENSMFQFGKVLTQSLVSTFGTVQIAANAVGNAVTPLQYIPGSAVGLAMVTVVGQCVGAREREQAKKYTLKLMGIAYLSIFAVVSVICIFMPQVVGLYRLSPESSELAGKLLIMHSITVCTIWPTAFVLPNCFRAASDVRYPMVISVLSMWIFRVGLSYVFGKYLGWGVIGVWLAMFSDWAVRAVFYVTRYFRGVWLTKYKPLNLTEKGKK